jgi:hypothetical protein
MPYFGPCVTGKYAGAMAARPIVAKGAYPGACKLVGYNTFAGNAAGMGYASKGLCLGLGLGLGVMGPLLVLGAGVVGAYLLFKENDKAMNGSSAGKTASKDIEKY